MQNLNRFLPENGKLPVYIECMYTVQIVKTSCRHSPRRQSRLDSEFGVPDCMYNTQ